MSTLGSLVQSMFDVSYIINSQPKKNLVFRPNELFYIKIVSIQISLIRSQIFKTLIFLHKDVLKKIHIVESVKNNYV